MKHPNLTRLFKEFQTTTQRCFHGKNDGVSCGKPEVSISFRLWRMDCSWIQKLMNNYIHVWTLILGEYWWSSMAHVFIRPSFDNPAIKRGHLVGHPFLHIRHSSIAPFLPSIHSYCRKWFWVGRSFFILFDLLEIGIWKGWIYHHIWTRRIFETRKRCDGLRARVSVPVGGSLHFWCHICCKASSGLLVT